MWCPSRFNIGGFYFLLSSFIYMHDICNASELLFSIMYADDISVQISGNDITYLVSSLNVQLELLYRWFKLSLNAKNTFFLVFHRATIKDHDLIIRIDGSTLNRSNNIKCLGVIIDYKFNWCEHIAHIKIM